MPIKNNDFFKTKKPWSITKDELLGCYLKPYFAKILTTRRDVCYIDCFAGKGKFDDGSKGSPLIASDILEQCANSSTIQNTNIFAYFIELNYSKELEFNLSLYKHKSIHNEVINGKFEENIIDILKQNFDKNIFLYIDPYGIKAIDVDMFNNFLTCSKFYTIEILLNFNTFGFLREGCRIMKVHMEDIPEITEYLYEYDPSTFKDINDMNNIAGGSYWQDIIKEYKDGKYNIYEAERKLSQGIKKSFERAYKYVLDMPVYASDNTNPKYRLFFMTNHSGGYLLMVDNMAKRSEIQQIRIRNGQVSLFDFDLNDEYYMKEEIIEKIGNITFNREIRLDSFLVKFYKENGIICDNKTLKDLIKQSNKFEIRREPSLTKTGKPSNFFDEKNGHKVFLRRKS